MNQIKNLLFLFCILIVLALVEGCSKGKLGSSYLIGEENKAQNPFNGGEKLTYITNEGEQIIFLVNERDNIKHEVLESINSKDYYIVEVDKTYFRSDGVFSFFIQMEGQYDPYVKFYISINDQDGFRYETGLPLSKENTPFVDSLLIMGNWEKDVFYFEKEQEENRAYKMYYSTKNGIVHIDFSDGGFWELESIEW